MHCKIDEFLFFFFGTVRSCTGLPIGYHSPPPATRRIHMAISICISINSPSSFCSFWLTGLLFGVFSVWFSFRAYRPTKIYFYVAFATLSLAPSWHSPSTSQPTSASDSYRRLVYFHFPGNFADAKKKKKNVFFFPSDNNLLLIRSLSFCSL